MPAPDVDRPPCLADELNALLLEPPADQQPLNRTGAARQPALDLLTTKWSGARQPLPSFPEHAGVAGGAVTDTRLYCGLAALLGMAQTHIPPGADLAGDLTGRLEAAGS